VRFWLEKGCLKAKFLRGAHASVQAKGLEKKLLQAESELEETQARAKAMGEHIRGVQQEIQQTQVWACHRSIDRDVFWVVLLVHPC
jgi:hypothetical protein